MAGKYGPECPKCDGYMHRCKPGDEKGVGKCMGQIIPLPAPDGHVPPSNHPPGDWWICVFCDFVQAA